MPGLYFLLLKVLVDIRVVNANQSIHLVEENSNVLEVVHQHVFLHLFLSYYNTSDVLMSYVKHLNVVSSSSITVYINPITKFIP
jgi:hypothetical protein